MCRHDPRCANTCVWNAVWLQQKSQAQWRGGTEIRWGGGLERDYLREAPAREGQNCMGGGVAPPPPGSAALAQAYKTTCKLQVRL